MKKIIGQLNACLCLFVLALAVSSAVKAQDLTLDTLIERQKIQDLITRYYYNFGGTPESFANFYVENGELVIMGQRYQGRSGVAKAYAFSGGQAPRNFSFNSLISNLLISVTGDTASAQLVWTENVVQKERDPVQQPFQGREYSTFVKINGKWMYKTRELRGGTEPPAGWSGAQ